MDFFNFLDMIGGLAMFLYGMHVMGNGLSKMAGGRLEKILEKLTHKRIFAVILGAGVTAIIQSSSASTVMVVGFVNSGIMELKQAAGIIMGANIGTTVTSWILSLTGIEGDAFWLTLLKPSSFSPVLAAIGIILIMAGKNQSKKKDIGGILLGFSILMFGMERMSQSVAGLADVPAFTGLMTAFSNPLLGMAAGAVLTAVIQSSSASVGILQALCASGGVTFSSAVPIIMGQNIGTCITSLLSAAGASKNAKRAAMIHLYFNLIGTVIFMAAFYLINSFVSFAFLSEPANAAGIAVIHSFFNIGTAVLLLPFADQLVHLAEITIPDKKEEAAKSDDVLAPIDERFLTRPAFAMELCRNRAREMAKVTEKSILLAMEVLIDYDEEKVEEVKRLEKMIDQYEDTLGSYLVKLSAKNITVRDGQSMSIILHSISDFERISDHALSVVESAEELHEKELAFSAPATEEIRTLCRALKDITGLTSECFCTRNLKEVLRVEPMDEVIEKITKKIKGNHILRLRNGQCTIEIGFILEDVLTDLKRVADHCSNVAVEMITICGNDYNTHSYFKELSPEEQVFFNEQCVKLSEKYPIAEMSEPLHAN